MISKSSRKKIAIYSFILFILSRFADIGATWYYSPNLAYEANPIATSWERIWIITFVLILTILHCCYRLAKANYNKPLQGEWLIKKFAGEGFGTPVKRYTFEFSFLITAIMAGFILAILWYLAHSLRLDSVNYFLGLEIRNMPISIPTVVVLPWIISYKLLDWYFAKKSILCVN